jgi:NADH-quinone oxidoreductase subunit K
MEIPQIGSLVYWTHFVVAALFALGLVGLLVRKNAIVVLMCLEIMLNAVNLLLVETAVRTNTPDGMILVVFVVTIAAAEVAVGLGIVLNLYRLKGTIEIDTFRSLQG